jgi:aerobic carbon-monoxide dehydrogenase medium subunit
MIPAAFAYHRPGSLNETFGLLAQHGEDAWVVAGGHSLIPMMKLRLARPEHLVDLQDVEELRGIRSEPDAMIIGAMTTQHELIGSELLRATCPIIRETALQIADPQVRYCGTLGGNVANGDPGNDMPAVMLALDARYCLKRRDGEREVAARDFYRGVYSTALQSDEI